MVKLYQGNEEVEVQEIDVVCWERAGWKREKPVKKATPEKKRTTKKA